tara:strand:+ start:1366 stop:1680 length:315 start_codon:yes stop_codon:yes gene_type:complete
MSNKEFQDFQNNLITVLKNKQLLLVPNNVGIYAMQFYEKRNQMFRRFKVTPYQIIKWDMLNGVKSIKTVHNMVKDKRIESFETAEIDGKFYIITAAIKRINEGD